MLTDFASLGLAWFGFRLARRPASWRRTYGFDRFSVLVAFINGLALFVIAAGIVVEAWQRLEAPACPYRLAWAAPPGLHPKQPEARGLPTTGRRELRGQQHLRPAAAAASSTETSRAPGNRW